MKPLIQKLGILMAMLSAFLSASAYDFEVDGIYYDFVQQGDIVSCRVVKGDVEYSGDIVIPSEVEFRNRMLAVTEIGDYAFGGCESISSIEIPNSVTKIGYDAFAYCRSLTSIEIPNSVTGELWGTFRDCTSLSSVKLSNSITKFIWGVFEGCKKLASISIPQSVVAITSDSFKDTAITEMTFEKGENKLSLGDPIYTSPIKVNIGRNLKIFSDSDNDNDLINNLPPKSWESSLEELAINVDFDEPTSSFGYCEKLKTLNIGEDVTSLENFKFSTTHLLDVTCLATIPPSGCNFSLATYTVGTLYVHESSIEAYQNAEGWKDFWEIKAIEQTGIEDVEADSESSRPDVIYDLIGRRLTEPQPGFNIINGKKVYVK